MSRARPRDSLVMWRVQLRQVSGAAPMAAPVPPGPQTTEHVAVGGELWSKAPHPKLALRWLIFLCMNVVTLIRVHFRHLYASPPHLYLSAHHTFRSVTRPSLVSSPISTHRTQYSLGRRVPHTRPHGPERAPCPRPGEGSAHAKYFEPRFDRPTTPQSYIQL